MLYGKFVTASTLHTFYVTRNKKVSVVVVLFSPIEQLCENMSLQGQRKKRPSVAF